MKREPPCKARRFYLERVEWTMRSTFVTNIDKIFVFLSCSDNPILLDGATTKFFQEINEEVKFPSNETNKKMLFPANISSGVSTSDQIRAT